MNYLIGNALNKNRGVGSEQGGNPCGSDRGISCEPYVDSPGAQSLRETSLPWEILEAAHSLFRKKGFERTSIADLCKRLEIKPSEFYNYFNSLDEVLEILWAR